VSEWFGVLVYLVYGLSFFTLGITAFLVASRGETVTALTRCLPLLGGFGVTHGTLEWIILFLRYYVTPPAYIATSLAALLLTAVSFSLLMHFGLSLLQRYRGWNAPIQAVPWFLFFVYALASVLVAVRARDVVATLNLVEQVGRVVIAFPASLTVSLGLIHSTQGAHNTGRHGGEPTARRLRLLAGVFLVYGLLAGLVVDPVRFYDLTGVPVELLRASLAVAALIVFFVVTEEDRRLASTRLNSLRVSRLVQQDRDRISRELHDRVIQVLFAAGLRLEQAADAGCLFDESEELRAVQSSLNHTIREIRGFIAESRSPALRVSELIGALGDRCDILRATFDVDVVLITKFDDRALAQRIQPYTDEMCAILTEAVANAVRHGRARLIRVSLHVASDQLELTIRDNGSGFDARLPSEGLGLPSMRTRTENCGGRFSVESTRTGSLVSAVFFLEDLSDDG
jgi:two-component system, NarL family, sensor histidine kinase YdfH